MSTDSHDRDSQQDPTHSRSPRFDSDCGSSLGSKKQQYAQSVRKSCRYIVPGSCLKVVSHTRRIGRPIPLVGLLNRGKMKKEKLRQLLLLYRVHMQYCCTHAVLCTAVQLPGLQFYIMCDHTYIHVLQYRLMLCTLVHFAQRIEVHEEDPSLHFQRIARSLHYCKLLHLCLLLLLLYELPYTTTATTILPAEL